MILKMARKVFTCCYDVTEVHLYPSLVFQIENLITQFYPIRYKMIHIGLMNIMNVFFGIHKARHVGQRHVTGKTAGQTVTSSLLEHF